MNKFSKLWIKSKNPKKQRKYRVNAPNQTKGKFLSSNLDKSLRKKFSCRSLRLRSGDKVRVLRGTFKGKEVKIDSVNVTNSKVYSSKITLTKKDNSTTQVPLEPSNLQIIDLNLDDKRRLKILERKK